MYQILEQEYANFVDHRYAISCSSGTSALHLALVALGIGPGDEVIVPDFTMAACGFAVSYVSGKVVSVDCGSDLCIQLKLVESKITPRTKAIMAVHIYGRLCDMGKLREICDRHKLFLIEDACEAQGAVYDSKADITCYSFYKNKIIHAEEGGIITTNSKELADDIKDLKNMAFGKEHNYFHKRIGFNYRMPESQAWIALKSLREYPINKQKRLEFEEKWNQIYPTKKRDAVWVYDIVAEDEKHKQMLIEEFTAKKLPWRHFFQPLSTMPMWKQRVGENALDYSRRGLYICYEN